VVRAAEPPDVSALVKLAAELARFQDLGDRFAATEAGIRGGLFGRHRSAEALVAERRGEIIGYAIVARSFSSTSGAPKLIVEDAFVAPDQRGCGAGSALFRAIARRAKEMGACRAEWTVLRDNHQALEFYDKLGAKSSPQWITCTMESQHLDDLTGMSGTTLEREPELPMRAPGKPDIAKRTAECC
jgi:GNAT superfamily N-acetyltransferase